MYFGARMQLLSIIFFLSLSGAAYSLDVQDDQFNRIISDPLVKPHYQKCVAQGKSADKLSACIWVELGKNPDDQKQIVDKYFNNEKTKNRYDSLERKTIAQGEDPAIKKLEEYMSKKLEETLYGEISANKKTAAVADHAVFYSLYKNQLSKNIITSISSYCIEAGSVQGLPIISSDESKRIEQRKSNLATLKEFTQSSDNEQVNQAYSKWGLCLSQLTAVCTLSPGDDEDRDDRVYSKNRACVLTNYLKQLRQGLIAADAIEKQVKLSEGDAGFSPANVRIYTGKGDEKTASINELTSMSSNEFVNKSGYADSIDEKKARLTKCIESKDVEQCKEFLESPAKRKELEDAVAEYDLQKRMMKNKLEKMNADQLRDYLKEEGRTEADIERMLASDESIDSVKMEINRNYDAEREAIVNQMKEAINKRTIASDSKGFETELTKLETIQRELSQQGESYKQLIHYNNIVSGFLTVADSSGKTVGSNVQSIQREMADSAYNQKNGDQRAPASANGEVGYFEQLSKKLNEMVEASDDSKKDDKHDATPIGTDTINKNIFKYDADKSDKEKEK